MRINSLRIALFIRGMASIYKRGNLKIDSLSLVAWSEMAMDDRHMMAVRTEIKNQIRSLRK